MKSTPDFDPAALLQHYLTIWQLADPQPLAQTPTSHVYIVTQPGSRVILKILTPYGVEERRGALALQHFNGHGAVYLLNHDDGAHLLEYADGANLTGLVQTGQDEAATVIIAGVINALHTNPAPPPPGIIPLREWFRALFTQADHDDRLGRDTVIRRAARIAETVLAEPQEPRVLHGDIHHENIRQASRGWLAFDPKGVYGERTYDLANTLCNPPPQYGVRADDEARILRNAGILAQQCGIDRGRVLLFLYLYACLSASWTLQDAAGGWDIATITHIAEIAERHL